MQIDPYIRSHESLRSMELSAQRRAMICELIEAGYSQSDIAREMGVSRQAVQKMLAMR